MEGLPGSLNSLSSASPTAAASATEEEISSALQTGSDGVHRITPLPAAEHSYVLSDANAYPTYPGFENAAHAVSVASPRVLGSITPETAKDAAASARAAAQAAREAQPNVVDGSYLIPQLQRLGNVSSASTSLNQRVENQVAIIMEEVRQRVGASVQQAQGEVQNSIALAERAATKLERAA